MKGILPLAAAVLVLDEFEVAVAVRLGLDGRDFSLYPEALREGRFEFLPDHCQEFRQIDVIPFHLLQNYGKIRKELLSLPRIQS